MNNTFFIDGCADKRYIQRVRDGQIERERVLIIDISYNGIERIVDENCHFVSISDDKIVQVWEW